MADFFHELLNQFLERGLWPSLFSIAGFLLAFFLVARLMSEKRAPANTLAWLLGIVLVPYIGVPFYLLFGGRKLRQLAELKGRLRPALPPGAPLAGQPPVAHTVIANGAPAPLAGNRLDLLTTGEAAYAALEQRIRAARHCIHVATFILGRDDTGRRIVALLAERARAGVKVRLLLDAVGCMFVRRHFVRPILDAGGEVAWFMPVRPLTSRGSANLRNHRKIAVFDHRTAIIGGHNLAREYMGPTPLKKRWRDFGAVIEGPAAVQLNEVFIADWCFASGQKPETLQAECDAAAQEPCGDSALQVVASGPDVAGDPLYEGIVAMIQEAKHSLWVVTPYFLPDEVLLRSLLVKAHTGCAITLIIPARSNHPITDFARRHYVRILQEAGVRVRLFGPGMMHSKAVISDDTTAVLGSANFDPRSLFVNFEIGVLVHSTPDVLAVRAWAEEQLKQCREPGPDRLRRHRVLSGIIEDLSRLLAPFL